MQELGVFKEQEEGHKEGGTQWLKGRSVGPAQASIIICVFLILFLLSSTIYFRKTSKLPIDLCVLSSLVSIPERFFSFILNSLLSSELYHP